MPEYVEGTFRCSICAKEFLTRNETKKHIEDTHAGEVTVVTEQSNRREKKSFDRRYLTVLTAFGNM